jgi:hypothetical protein
VFLGNRGIKMGRLEDIKIELDTDPGTKGYAGKSDQATAVLMRVVDIEIYSPVEVSSIFNLLASDGTWGAIMAAAADSGDANHAICLNALSMIEESRKFTGRAEVKTGTGQLILLGMEASGMITAGQKTAIEDIGKCYKSRAELIGVLGHVSATEINQARSL